MNPDDHTVGVSLVELAQWIPDKVSAEKWFESVIWPDDRKCPAVRAKTRTRQRMTMICPIGAGTANGITP